MPAILVASHRRQQSMTILQCSQLLSVHTSEHDQIRVSCLPLLLSSSPHHHSLLLRSAPFTLTAHHCIRLHALDEQLPLPGSIWLSTMSCESGRKSVAASISTTQPNRSSAPSWMRNEFVCVTPLSASVEQTYRQWMWMRLPSVWLR